MGGLGLKYWLEKQRKLTAFALSAGILFGGLWVPADDAKYSSFALAVSALGSVLVGAHAYQKKGSTDAQ